MQKQIIIIAAGLLVALGSAYYVFSPGDDPSEDPEIDIELLSEPVTGESNTVQAQKNGTALAGETLYLNGEEYGELNNAGITEFTTPDTEELTLEVSDASKTIAINETDEVDEEPEETELVLDSEPEVGEMNRVLLYINGERTSGETIYLNDEELGETSNAGTITFTVPNEEEIILSTGLDEIEDKTVTPEGYEDEEETEEDDTEETNETEEETREGLELRHEPVAEEHNTITLYQDNEPVEDETILVNDEEEGETDEFGELEFQVPNEEEIDITTENEADEKTRTVEGYESEDPIELNVLSPNESDEVEDYKYEFDWTVKTNQDDFEYTTNLLLNDEERFEKTGTGTNNFQEEIIIGDADTHQLEIETITEDEDVYTEEVKFETTEDIPEPEVKILSPDDGEEIDDFLLDIEFEFRYLENFTMNIVSEDNLLREIEWPSGGEEVMNEQVAVEEGLSDLGVEFEMNEFDRTFAEKVAIETNQERPELFFADKFGPPYDEGYDDTIAFEIMAFEDMKADIILENLDEGSTVELKSFDLERGEEEIIEQAAADEVTEGDQHAWHIDAESIETGKSRESDPEEFEGQ